MLSSQELSSLVIVACSFLIGISESLLILAVKCMEWRQKVELNACDLIICSMGGCNLLLQCVSITTQACIYLWHKTFALGPAALPLYAIRDALYSCNLWFSTWLCVYYCLKIVNSQQTLFLWMKAKFHTVLPWLLICSVLLSLAISLSVIWDTEIVFPANQTSYELNFKSRCSCTTPLYVALSCLALTVSCCAAVAILISTWKHVRRMQQNTESSRGPQLGAHLGVAKMVTSLLLVSFASCLTLILTNVFSQIHEMISTMQLIDVVAQDALPCVNVFILIMGNSRLRKAACGLIRCGKCCTKGGA